MRLVTFQEPIFQTIQGEGILTGTPSVFVRLYGCDYSCEWCDTKGSWKAGSFGKDWDLDEIVAKILSFRIPHVVITGGNPLLQGDEVALLVAKLRSFKKHHVTIETQASVFHEEAVRSADLVSMSPKLHQWPGETLEQFLHVATEVPFGFSRSGTSCTSDTAQVKIVVQSKADVDQAVNYFGAMIDWSNRHGRARPKFILQPESGLGRSAVKWAVEGALENKSFPVLVIPQIHKTSLYVV